MVFAHAKLSAMLLASTGCHSQKILVHCYGVTMFWVVSKVLLICLYSVLGGCSAVANWPKSKGPTLGHIIIQQVKKHDHK